MDGDSGGGGAHDHVELTDDLADDQSTTLIAEEHVDIEGAALFAWLLCLTAAVTASRVPAHGSVQVTRDLDRWGFQAPRYLAAQIVFPLCV